LSAKYKDYASILGNQQPVNFKGNRLPRAPEFTAASALVLDNLRLGDAAEGSVRLEYNYRDKTFFTRENIDGASQDSYGLVNVVATVEFADGRWGLTASLGDQRPLPVSLSRAEVRGSPLRSESARAV
jgi:iron complex outermembrane recepter protein